MTPEVERAKVARDESHLALEALQVRPLVQTFMSFVLRELQ